MDGQRKDEKREVARPSPMQQQRWTSYPAAQSALNNGAPSIGLPKGNGAIRGIVGGDRCQSVNWHRIHDSACRQQCSNDLYNTILNLPVASSVIDSSTSGNSHNLDSSIIKSKEKHAELDVHIYDILSRSI